MSTVFRPSTAADEHAVINLLNRAFSAPPDKPNFQPQMLRWKYWEPREDWPEPRAYVLERDGRLAAHAGLWPVTLTHPGGCERGVHMIDWAGDPEFPGAGVSLLQRLTRMFSFVYSIGGSDMTQEILPKFGFRRVAEALSWARPLRPWRQIALHPHKDLRLPARLGRNLWWAMSPARKPQSAWQAVETAPGQVVTGPGAERDGRFFEYLSRCPVISCRIFQILKEGHPAGFFALSLVQRQARVIGIWLEDPGADNRQRALELAQDAALRSTDACEMTAQGTYDPSAAAAAGMRVRGSAPVFFFRRGSPELPELSFQIADNDNIFLADRTAPFLC
jgi:hypothetical protein